ncbi:MAG: ribbon-helix-helix protein, CopG family [Candidatus Lokiarchaeota archaeon]|nr:ribbon-helix-helix protein, CopG family [Candidatus Lokiarchaeota archaeon]MBD3200722.1 ribbon-helix-helix protein, CopG family [Candidatus Lokiarchaeota archaeon]
MSPVNRQRNGTDKKSSKNNDTVLTVRISSDLDETLNKICNRRRLTKAAVIREYLEMAKYFLIDRNSINSLNENELIILKRNYFKKIIEDLNEVTQIELGTELARFINDLARLEGKLDDKDYKLDLCEEYGLFPKFIDAHSYILFSKKFGPKKFVEAFAWQFITKGEKGDFSIEFTTEQLEDSSKLKKRYEETISPIRRDATHYAFEFAKSE